MCLRTGSEVIWWRQCRRRGGAKSHTPHSKRVGPNKTCRANKNIRKHKGRVHAFVRWSNFGWIGGSARLDLRRGGGRFEVRVADLDGLGSGYPLFFCPPENRMEKRYGQQKNSGFGADEIWQKVRTVKEGSNYFRGREKKKRAQHG